MKDSILIIEDEVFIALEMRRILEQGGHHVVGIAADIGEAMSFAYQEIALALVDLNLRDGLTGPQVGMKLADKHGTAVVFVTANPRLLGDGVDGTIGVLTKPVGQEGLLLAVDFALGIYRGQAVNAPNCMHCFN